MVELTVVINGRLRTYWQHVNKLLAFGPMTALTGVDPSAPVIIGAGQVTHRDRGEVTSAATLIALAAGRALDDTGAAATVRDRLASIGVTHCLSGAGPDPAGTLAAGLGVTAVRTVATRPGGTGPLDLLRHACAAVAAGESGVLLLAGGEAIRALSQGYTDGADGAGVGPPDEVLGSDRGPSHPAEERAGMFQPLNFYPLFENAVRGAGGRPGLHAPGLPAVPVAEHQKWLGDLWARFAQVAATNPYAWLNGAPPDAAHIAAPGGRNRMVAHPYTKLLTANITVDQAAAVVVCSAATAAALGVPRDRWVFVAAGASAHDHWYVAEREHLHRSPAIAATGRAVLSHTGLGTDDIAHLDIYSCFPSAVQIAAAELGVDLSLRTPTVTGGLTFAGGPASSYSFHALATLTERLRAGGADDAGLLTAVGWFLTKHAAAVLTAAPPARPYRHADVQAEVDGLPRRRVAQEHRGAATVESWTATYDRDGSPSVAVATSLLPDGSRAVAVSTDPGAVAEVVRADPIGATLRLDGDGTFTL
jgi:acetyl-CoA C-acetyltransferase